jgi:hypothetical protein
LQVFHAVKRFVENGIVHGISAKARMAPCIA